MIHPYYTLDATPQTRVTLHRCVIETYQRNDSKFLLRPSGKEKQIDDLAADIAAGEEQPKGGSMFSRRKRKEALATAEEIEAAAEMLMEQAGFEPLPHSLFAKGHSADMATF